MDKLKRAFDAARGFKGHSLEDACQVLRVSRTMLNQFFKENTTSAPLEKRVRKYISEAGVVRSINELGLNPDTTKRELANANK